MDDIAPTSPSDDPPTADAVALRPRIVFRTALLALFAVVAACSLLAPWQSEPDLLIGDLGCIARHGGCPESVAPSTSLDVTGVDIAGVWPVLILFGLAGLATCTAVIAIRVMQAVTGTCAVVISLFLAPYVVSVSKMAGTFAAKESSGAEGAFYIMLLLTFVAGIANVAAPPASRPLRVELPRARARIHVSGMKAAARTESDARTSGSSR